MDCHIGVLAETGLMDKVHDFFGGLDEVLLPREVKTALRLLSSISSAPGSNANVTLARYIPDFATNEAYREIGVDPLDKVFEELSELAKTPRGGSMLCYFAGYFVLISPGKSRDEIIDIIRGKKARNESFEFINSGLAETNPSWFKSILTRRLDFTESAIEEIESTEYLATAIRHGCHIDDSLRDLCEVSKDKNIPIVLCLEGRAFTITPGLTGSEAIIRLELLREEKLEQSSELSRLLAEQFDSLEFNGLSIEALTLIDYMMIQTLNTTGKAIVPASEVEEALNKAGVFLPPALNRWCQEDGQETDNEQFEADRNAFLDGRKKLFESADFALCLHASLEMALANYLYAAYFGMQLFSPEEFLSCLVENFRAETETLLRYMQMTSRQ
jgi:hypothetical protein